LAVKATRGDALMFYRWWGLWSLCAMFLMSAEHSGSDPLLTRMIFCSLDHCK
jgi:hypothetical protein